MKLRKKVPPLVTVKSDSIGFPPQDFRPQDFRPRISAPGAVIAGYRAPC